MKDLEENEKSKIDFKFIINSEIRNLDTKNILDLEDNINIDEYINKLKTKA